jgi:CPA1 family monovalent cation:H+ antiporter
MVISLSLSLGIVGIEHLGYLPEIHDMVVDIDFNETLMVGFLSFLLFAGALHLDINSLLNNKLEIFLFSTLGVVLSTVIVSALTFFIFTLTGFPVPLKYCILFGALISPTDPIAVIGLLKQLNAPEDLSVKIAGDSLFNDGVGVIMFLIALEISRIPDLSGINISSVLTHAGYLFFVEITGGILIGLALGYTAYFALKKIDQYEIEILITLALVSACYALALHLHTSGPIAVVVAGLLIGNSGRQLAMSDKTRDHLDSFWSLLDSIINAALFILIGFQIIIIPLKANYLLLGLMAIPIVLLARFCSIGLPVSILRPFKSFTPHTIKIMTWGGLRGGISVALSLSLASSNYRDLLITITYMIVIFSVIIQGLTVKYLVKQETAAG